LPGGVGEFGCILLQGFAFFGNGALPRFDSVISLSGHSLHLSCNVVDGRRIGVNPCASRCAHYLRIVPVAGIGDCLGSRHGGFVLFKLSHHVVCRLFDCLIYPGHKLLVHETIRVLLQHALIMQCHIGDIINRIAMPGAIGLFLHPPHKFIGVVCIVVASHLFGARSRLFEGK